MANSIIGAGIIGLPFSFKEAVSGVLWLPNGRLTVIVLGLWYGSDPVDRLDRRGR